VHASVRVNRGSRQRARERLRRYNSAAGQLARRPAALERANQPEASGEIRASWSQQHLRQVVGTAAARACRQEISTELGGDGGVMVRASSVAPKGAPHFLTIGHAHAHTPNTAAQLHCPPLRMRTIPEHRGSSAAFRHLCRRSQLASDVTEPNALTLIIGPLELLSLMHKAQVTSSRMST
jgi:hypothetical protein